MILYRTMFTAPTQNIRTAAASPCAPPAHGRQTTIRYQIHPSPMRLTGASTGTTHRRLDAPCIQMDSIRSRSVHVLATRGAATRACTLGAVDRSILDSVCTAAMSGKGVDNLGAALVRTGRTTPALRTTFDLRLYLSLHEFTVHQRFIRILVPGCFGQFRS